MSEFFHFVENYLGVKATPNHNYCKVGHAFYLNDEDIEGTYWFYENEQFIIDIHDFFIKKEQIKTNLSDISPFISFVSSYIVSANGENFNPYQTLSPNSLFIADLEHIQKDTKFLLHENYPYLGVAVNFKKGMLDAYLSDLKVDKNVNFSDIFFQTKAIIVNTIEKLAKDILSCKMTSPAAELFLDAKAKEWLSITLDAYLNRNVVHISQDDEIALANVVNYLNDHYAMSVSQDTLEKIAMMSGTKLKTLFKHKYQLTISEYTQRKRMTIAETLLSNSSLQIKDVAKAVGYSSHSKFSACFKKYKGLYPKDVKKHTTK